MKVTDHTYVRHDGGSDATIQSCSSDAPGPPNGGERQQNEPTDGTDGFDVLQCRTQSTDGSWSADTCPNAGGLDQNIFGAILGP